jgi:hypothetical protein
VDAPNDACAGDRFRVAADHLGYFLYGPRDASGRDTYVLYEINVSSVFPFPEEAPAEIARLATVQLVSKKRRAAINH